MLNETLHKAQNFINRIILVCDKFSNSHAGECRDETLPRPYESGKNVVHPIILFSIVFLSISPMVSATHIVGGIITYEYINDSSYEITLKLYRDCCPTCAALPASVSIQVQQPDGSEFVPSKDFTISLDSFVNLPSNLDTCAIPPNPMPCVQEAFYSAIVTDLPPNPGGYHIYSQYCCRNLSTTNADMSCNCIGESFYSFLPGTTSAWVEYFNLANGTTNDAGATAWSSAAGAPPPASASVNNNAFRTTGADNGQAVWTSEYIDISAFAGGVDIKVDLTESGTLEPDDTIRIFYRLDNGPLILFSYNGILADDFTRATASDSGLVGDSVQIAVQIDYGASSPNTEIYTVDNVSVAADDFQPNNAPYFNWFPPLFLCVGEYFTFDHSATDPDGDSLVYSFYNPFTDDPPSFPGNQANFTLINWLAGYSTNSPLNAGGPALSINSLTGLLSGVANSLGRYIVGIKVEEYRNGVKINESIRDFQFNIAFCGFPGEANIDTTGDLYSCSGYSLTFPNQSDTAANNWWWNFGDLTAADDTSVLEFPTYTYPDTGKYYVTLITNRGTMCADTAYDTVHVSLLTAGFVSDSSSCAGDTVNFVDVSTVSANDNIIGWNWDFDDGTFSTLQNPVHIFTDSGTYNVQLIVTSALGCSDTITKPVVIDYAPVFVLNLTGVPDSVWTSSSVKRKCQVCSATGQDVCVTFIVTLDPGTQMISFNIASGAIPPGALSYEINCANPTKVGDSICLNGVGPHQITFCKPGNNPNTYSITAIPKPSAGGNIVVTDACVDTLVANGYSEWTIHWTSVYPGTTGAYDNYLSCSSGCDTTVVTAQPGYPPYIDYRVCGSPVGGCYTDTVCDTARVFFVTSLLVDILPQNPTICFGGANTTITATPAGGAPPYSYQWNTGATSSSISVGVGTYSVMVVDSTGCPPVYDSVTVTAFLSPISADAGPDRLICATNPVTLAGMVTAASGGTWSGGGGTYSPSADSLNTNYSPTAGEIAGGSMPLYLTTTGNGSCPADTDTVIISYYSLTALTLSSTPVSCAGGANGTITAFPIGANPPVTYQWNDPLSQTAQTATGLTADTFTVTVTDADNCTITATTTITEPDTIIITIAVSNATCYALCNGNAAATITGGVAPYSYSWSNGGTNSNIFGLCKGNYTVTVTDNNNCTMTYTDSVAQPSAAVLATNSAVNVTCIGLCNGTITASAAGGTGIYTFNWSNGMNGTTISGLCTGTYIVTVTDANGCTSAAASTITEPAAVTVSISDSNVTCTGFCNGSITAAGTGGTGAYTFNWSNGMNGAAISSLCTGNYTVTVTDANGCTSTGTDSITEPAAAVTVAATVTNVTCTGLCNGTITVTGTGGTGTYTFNWSNGMNGATISGLCPNSYTVTITDANGCTSAATSLITEPQAVAVTTTVSNATCTGICNGSITASGSGGTGAYTFNWSNGMSSVTIGNLCTGNYTVIITDANGCTSTDTATITEPATALSVATTITNVTCTGLCNGTITATGSGGTGTYTFDWSNGMNGASIGNLCTGNYTVTITDSNSCSNTMVSTITEPISLSALISAVNLACYGLCSGSADVTASGGTAPYSYFWSNAESTKIISGLCATTYRVTVTDANACTVTDSVQLTQPLQPVDMVLSISNVKCNSANDGYASVTPSGGTPPYTYQWDAATGSQTDSIATGLYAGNYSVTVFDNQTCSIDTPVTLTQPATALAMSTDSTEVTCYGANDGTATVIVSGGKPPYSYQWDSAAAFQTTSIATGLAIGTYFVTITDSCGCRVDSISVTITSIPEIILNFSCDSVSCAGGSDGIAVALPSGGTPPFTYQWDSTAGFQTDSAATGLQAGIYAITVTDFTNCAKEYLSVIVAEPTFMVLTPVTDSVSCYGGSDGTAFVVTSGGTPPYVWLWNTGDTTQGLVSLPAGNYSVTVTDYNGCMVTSSASIYQPASALSDSLAAQNINCKGDSSGKAEIFAAGGTPPYSYLWSNGDPDAVAAAVSSGSYTVTVTDNHGCTLDTSITLTEPALALSYSAWVKEVNCYGGNNGEINLVPAGGIPPYTFLWDSSASWQTTSLATGLSSGNYSVTLTDSNNCVKNTLIFVPQPADSLKAFVIVTDDSCYGAADGTAMLSATGGLPPYTFLWDTGASSQTSSVATGLPSGVYYGSVADKFNCKLDSIIAVISQPPKIALNMSSTNVSCKGDSSGTATVLATGGTPPYSYLWSNGDTTNSSWQLAVGNYSIIVTDINGCVDTADVTITEPSDSLKMSVFVTDLLCYNDSSGTVTVSPSGGTPPYFYIWSTGDSMSGSWQSAIDTLQAGIYSVTITDSLGCNITDTAITLTQPTEIIAVASGADTVCPGALVTINAAASGGSGGGYIYIWSGGASTGQTQQVSPLSNTDFPVTATDSAGCVSMPDTVTVSVRNLYFDSMDVISSGNVCINSNDTVTIFGTYKEEFPPYTYSWNQGLGSGLGPFEVVPQDTSTFIMTVTDMCGNSISDSVIILVYPLPVIDLPPLAGEGCIPLTVNFEDTMNNNATYLWKFGDGSISSSQNPAHMYISTGTFIISLTINSVYNCTFTDDTASSVIIHPLPQPICSAEPPETDINHPGINFTVTPASAYFWSFGDGDTSALQSSLHSYSDTGNYPVTVDVANEFGCLNRCTLSVRITPVWEILVPNAFIPDAGGPNGGYYSFENIRNDIFFPLARYVKEYHLMIFNRWGELIFETFNIKQGWDGYYRGKLCQQDVYVWKIHAIFADENNTDIKRAGDVTLIR